MIIDKNVSSVREAILACFLHQKLDEGAQLLEKFSAYLPEAVRLECQGSLHFYRDELQKAVYCFEAAIVLAPERIISRYQYLVGLQEEREGSLVAAFERYQAAIEEEPEFVDAYIALGSLLVKVDDLEGAATCCRDAWKRGPLQIANRRNLLVILGKLAKADPARYQAELAITEAVTEILLQ
jgi:tetratricopeptide (TPR) repeat protein